MGHGDGCLQLDGQARGELPNPELPLLEGGPPGRTGGIQRPPGVQGRSEGRAKVSSARHIGGGAALQLRQQTSSDIFGRRCVAMSNYFFEYVQSRTPSGMAI